MKSTFYYGGRHREVAAKVRDYVNSLPDFLTAAVADSPRAVGDALETLIAKEFGSFLGEWRREYSSDFARRAMADMAFSDKEGVYSVVDVKTHREDTRFNMPALTSVERLSRFYESDANVFSILMVDYSVTGTKLTASKVLFCPMEFLDWKCLAVGALGWGQIQLADSRDVRVREGYSRKKWMLQLCDAMDEFYPREIDKIRSRMERFEAVRAYWTSREDVWS